MHYQQIAPPIDLAEYVKFFWILENMELPFSGTKELIVPDGCTELLFHYGDAFQRFDGLNVKETQDHFIVHGQIKRFIEIAPTGKTGILAVRFLPHGLQPFLPFPAKELTNESCSVATIFGSEGRELTDKLTLAINNLERIQLLQQFLIEQLVKNYQEDKLVKESIKRIYHCNGNIGIGELSISLGISERQLERRVIDAVGLNPKFLSRIVRFQNIFKLLKENEYNNLTTLAYEGGYYDQAHFIRDFKAFSGRNPSSYFKETHLFSDHITGT